MYFSKEKVMDSFASLSGDPENTSFLSPFKSASDNLKSEL